MSGERMDDRVIEAIGNLQRARTWQARWTRDVDESEPIEPDAYGDQYADRADWLDWRGPDE